MTRVLFYLSQSFFFYKNQTYIKPKQSYSNIIEGAITLKLTFE